MKRTHRSLEILLAFMLLSLSFLVGASQVHAASITLTGTAKVANTSAYLDLDSYNSNVSVDNTTGNFSGYGWLEDVGWVAFGTTDNSEGPVAVNLSTGAVTGKAKVLDTGAYLDFTNYGSNVTVVLSTGVFAGYVWSEDVGWIDFTDTGVSSASPLVTPTPTRTPTPTSAPSSNNNAAPTLPPEIANRLSNGYDTNGECVAQRPGGMPEIFRIDMSDTKATLYIAPPAKPYGTFTISYKEVGSIAWGFEHPVYADSPEYAIDFAHADDGGVVEYTINDLKPNTRYEFKVKCANKCASTAYGDTVAAATQVLGVATKKVYSSSDGTLSSTSNTWLKSSLASAGTPVAVATIVGMLILLSGVGVYAIKPKHLHRPLYTLDNPKRLRVRR